MSAINAFDAMVKYQMEHASYLRAAADKGFECCQCCCDYHVAILAHDILEERFNSAL